MMLDIKLLFPLSEIGNKRWMIPNLRSDGVGHEVPTKRGLHSTDFSIDIRHSGSQKGTKSANHKKQYLMKISPHLHFFPRFVERCQIFGTHKAYTELGWQQEERCGPALAGPLWGHYVLLSFADPRVSCCIVSSSRQRNGHAIAQFSTEALQHSIASGRV